MRTRAAVCGRRKANLLGRRSALIFSAVVLAAMLPASLPSAGGSPAPSAMISPAVALANDQSVTVSWRGFAPSQKLSTRGSVFPDEVGVYECVANPPGGVWYYQRDCYTAASPQVPAGGLFGPTEGPGGGNAIDPVVDGSGNFTSAAGTGQATFRVQEGTLATALVQSDPGESCGSPAATKACAHDFTIQCDQTHPCVLKVVDFSAAFLGKNANPGRPGWVIGYRQQPSPEPNLPPSPPTPGSWSAAVDAAPEVPLQFSPVTACPPPTEGSASVTGEGAPSAELAMQAWGASLCQSAAPLTVNFSPVPEGQAKADLAGGRTTLSLAGLAPTSLPAGGVLAAPLDVSGTSIVFDLADPVTGLPYSQVRLTPRLAAMLVTDSGTYVANQAYPAGTGSGAPLQHLLRDPEFVALNPGFVAPSCAPWQAGNPTIFPCGGMYPPVLLAGSRDDTEALTTWIASDYDARRFLAGEDPCAGVDQYWQGVSYPTSSFLDNGPIASDQTPASSVTVSLTGRAPVAALAISGVYSAGSAPVPGNMGTSMAVAPGPVAYSPGPLEAWVVVHNTSGAAVTGVQASGAGSIGAAWTTGNVPSPIYGPVTIAPGASVMFNVGVTPLVAGSQDTVFGVSGTTTVAGKSTLVAANVEGYYQGTYNPAAPSGFSAGTSLALSSPEVDGTPAGPGQPPVPAGGGRYTGTVTVTNVSSLPLTGISAVTSRLDYLSGPSSLSPGQSATYEWTGSTEPGTQPVQVLATAYSPSPAEHNAYVPQAINSAVALDVASDSPPGLYDDAGTYVRIPTQTSYVSGLMGDLDTATANEAALPAASLIPASPTSRLADYVTIGASPGQCTPISNLPSSVLAGFVAPTAASMTAAIPVMASATDGMLTPPVATATSGVYPLTRVDYGLVPAKGLSADAATGLSRFVAYAAGAGQSPSVLPSEYPPLPESLRTLAGQVADRIAEEVPGVPLPVPPAPTQPQVGTPSEPAVTNPAAQGGPEARRAAASQSSTGLGGTPVNVGAIGSPGVALSGESPIDAALAAARSGGWVLWALGLVALGLGVVGAGLRIRTRGPGAEG